MRVAQQGMIAAAVLGMAALALAIRTDMDVRPTQTREQALAAYGKLPLTFVENRGQKDGQVRYYAHGNRYAFYLTRDGVMLSFAKGSMALRFVDADKLYPSTNCGMAPLSRRVARGKLKALGAGAEIIRKELAA